MVICASPPALPAAFLILFLLSCDAQTAGPLVCGSNRFCVQATATAVNCYGSSAGCLWSSNDCSTSTDCLKYSTGSPAFFTNGFPCSYYTGQCPGTWQCDACWLSFSPTPTQSATQTVTPFFGPLVCGKNNFCVQLIQRSIYCFGSSAGCLWGLNDCSSTAACNAKYTMASPKYTDGPPCSSYTASAWAYDACYLSWSQTPSMTPSQTRSQTLTATQTRSIVLGPMVCGSNSFCVQLINNAVYCFGSTTGCLWGANDCSSTAVCNAKYTVASPKFSDGFPCANFVSGTWPFDACYLSWSQTRTPSSSPTASQAATVTSSSSLSVTQSSSSVATLSQSSSATQSGTTSLTQSGTVSPTQSGTASLTQSGSLTTTPSISQTVTPSATQTGSPTATTSPALTASQTQSNSLAQTGSPTGSPSTTQLPTLTQSPSVTQTASANETPSWSASRSPSQSVSGSPTQTHTQTPTQTSSLSPTQSSSAGETTLPSQSMTGSLTLSSSLTQSASVSAGQSPGGSGLPSTTTPSQMPSPSYAGSSMALPVASIVSSIPPAASQSLSGTMSLSLSSSQTVSNGAIGAKSQAPGPSASQSATRSVTMTSSPFLQAASSTKRSSGTQNSSVSQQRVASAQVSSSVTETASASVTERGTASASPAALLSSCVLVKVSLNLSFISNASLTPSSVALPAAAVLLRLGVACTANVSLNSVLLEAVWSSDSGAAPVLLGPSDPANSATGACALLASGSAVRRTRRLGPAVSNTMYATVVIVLHVCEEISGNLPAVDSLLSRLWTVVGAATSLNGSNQSVGGLNPVLISALGAFGSSAGGANTFSGQPPMVAIAGPSSVGSTSGGTPGGTAPGVGVIAGATVGGLGLLAIAAAAIFCARRRSKHAVGRPFSTRGKEHGNDAFSMANPGRRKSDATVAARVEITAEVASSRPVSACPRRQDALIAPATKDYFWAVAQTNPSARLHRKLEERASERHAASPRLTPSPLTSRFVRRPSNGIGLDNRVTASAPQGGGVRAIPAGGATEGASSDALTFSMSGNPLFRTT